MSFENRPFIPQVPDLYGGRYDASGFAPNVAPPIPRATRQQAPWTYQAPQPVQQAPAPVPPPTAVPPQQGGGNDAGPRDNSAVAQGYGYQRGTGNFGGLGSVIGFATGIPFVGAAAEKAQDVLGLPGNYGQHGTTDALGNTFAGTSGRAYDPITGRAVNSYRDTGAAWQGVKGSYQNLRKAGEGRVSSALGSFENSIHNPYYKDQGYLPEHARAARLRGGASAAEGITSTNALINQNSGLQEIAPVGSLDAAEASATPPAPVAITGEQLGFDNTRGFSAEQASQNTGVWGSDAGDLAATEFGPGVINESGQVEHSGGTVVALTDTSNPGGGNISLLNGNTQEARDELDRRAGKTPVRGPDQVIQQQRQESDNDSGGGGGGGK